MADCQKADCQDDTSCGEDEESTEGSLELVAHSSDDDLALDGEFGMPKLKNQILHKVELHAEHNSQDEPQDIKANGEENEPDLKNCSSDDLIVTMSESDYDILLASASIDGRIWIWNTKTGASCDNFARKIMGPQAKSKYL